MLSPYVKLHKNCVLCQKLLAEKNDPDFLFETNQHMCFKSPFAEKWPGALMPVFKRHLHEQKEIRSSSIPEALQSLICFERALKKVTKCNRINFVKFGNVTRHLQWHIIPRYESEIFSQKCPWELGEYTREELYEERTVPFISDIPLLYSQITQASEDALKHENPPYFGCALFLRPENKEKQDLLYKLNLDEQIQEARTYPAQWEGLLMKRNYFDYAWDIVGGNANAGEFPVQTMLREVEEELGWKIKEYQEVCRQWRRSCIKGFVYIAVPSEQNYFADNPVRKPCYEVQEVKYFNLLQMLNDDFFSDAVRGRIKAFLGKRPDFTSID